MTTKSNILKVAAQAALTEAWDPTLKPIHCANCRRTRVSGAADDPRVCCGKGHGGADRRTPVWALIRPLRPVCFRRAEDCPDFESMSDDVTPTPIGELVGAIVGE